MDSSSEKKGKNIVLCFDGTDNTFGPDPFSNVLKIYRMLETSDSTTQICYYQPGIGTSLHYDAQFGWSRLFSWQRVKMTLDSMIAYTLDSHIIKAYQYLMDHYEPGDRIIMFGFSRGAFIARLLAGMIERVGLLCHGLHDIVWIAWKIYTSWEYAAQPIQPTYETTLVEEFKKTFSRNIELEIYFQGLFDSVNSCGLLFDRMFPYTARSGIVRHIRHAVGIDERRGKFKQYSFSPNPSKPDLFSLSYKNYVVERESSNSHVQPQNESTDNQFIKQTLNSRPGTIRSDSSVQNLIAHINTHLENRFPLKRTNFVNRMVQGIFKFLSPSERIPERNVSHDLIEKWFPGDHSDVGGSWPPDISEDHHFMSDTALRWILAEAIKHKVLFKKGIIHEFAKKYTSNGAVLSACHDLLNFSGGVLTMKNPFQTEPLVFDREMLDNKHFSFSFFKTWVFGEQKKDVPLFRTFNFTAKSSSSPSTAQEHSSITFHSKNTMERDKKQDGFGNHSLFKVLCWWIAELIPIGIRMENKKCKWKNVYIPNLGRRRNLPADADLHWSVYWRVRYVKDYRPNNLPEYASELIEKYHGIKLHKTIEKDKTGIKNTFTSVTTSFDDLECQPLIPKEDNYDGCQFNNITELKYKSEKELQQWTEENWSTFPDDLIELLNQNPDL